MACSNLNVFNNANRLWYLKMSNYIKIVIFLCNCTQMSHISHCGGGGGSEGGVNGNKKQKLCMWGRGNLNNFTLRVPRDVDKSSKGTLNCIKLACL